MALALPVSPSPRLIWQCLCGFLLISCWLIAFDGFGQTLLSLPFFDDFSKASGRPGLDQPDPARWQPGSGVYINNTMAINQPTVNVATFDGLMANGLPYTQRDQFEQNYTDTLASLPINLAGLTATDSVYLSFYYQIKGLGELPDEGDSLTLQFKDKANVWRTVWAVTGGTPNNNFFQIFIPVRDASYLYAGFAFRFRSYGRRSGPFDTWNIDYVYLNKNRTRTSTFVDDIAVRQAFTPFLKRYTAMPLSHYLVNPARETADSVTMDINNLGIFNVTTYRFSVRDDVSGRVVQNDPQTATQLILSVSSQRKRIKVQPVSGLTNAKRAVLRYGLYLETGDPNDTVRKQPIPGVNLNQNDTLYAQAVLDDYFAYDDGSWEYGLQIGPSERVAVQFTLNKPDTLAGIRASIVPFKTNQSGQPFVLSVYGKGPNGRPGSVLYQKAFVIQYPANRNGFVYFPFDYGVSVKDTFYVGYQQISSSDTTFLRLGFDKNSPFGRQIFYNGGSTWEQNLSSPALSLQGAFMLRPVIGGKAALVTATEAPVPQLPLQAYPNPTSGLIRWDNSRVSRLEVLSLTGQLLYGLEPSRGQQTLDLSHLPDGMYLLRLFENERAVVQKLIIQH